MLREEAVPPSVDFQVKGRLTRDPISYEPLLWNVDLPASLGMTLRLESHLLWSLLICKVCTVSGCAPLVLLSWRR